MPTVHEIQKATAEVFGVTVEAIVGRAPAELQMVPWGASANQINIKGRAERKRLRRARAVAMALSYELSALSLEQVGKKFSNRHHTTVLHMSRTLGKACAQSQKLSARVQEIRRKLAAHETVNTKCWRQAQASEALQSLAEFMRQPIEMREAA